MRPLILVAGLILAAQINVALASGDDVAELRKQASLLLLPYPLLVLCIDRSTYARPYFSIR
jgi:hypothetical protein